MYIVKYSIIIGILSTVYLNKLVNVYMLYVLYVFYIHKFISHMYIIYKWTKALPIIVNKVLNLFINWGFTPLSTLFQLYHVDSSLIHDP